MTEVEGVHNKAPQNEHTPSIRTEVLYLAPYRNFYDQPPFQEVFTEGANHFLTRTGADVPPQDVQAGLQDTTSRFVGTLCGASYSNESSKKLLLSLGLASGNLQAFKEGVMGCVTGFDANVPAWRGYVASHLFLDGLYELSGAWKGSKGKITPPETYLAWSSGRSKISPADSPAGKRHRTTGIFRTR
jgi:hypothetical protein